jgi:hypothetical protein
MRQRGVECEEVNMKRTYVWAVIDCGMCVSRKESKDQKNGLLLVARYTSTTLARTTHTDGLTRPPLTSLRRPIAVWIVTGATLCPGTAWNLGIQHPTTPNTVLRL